MLLKGTLGCTVSNLWNKEILIRSGAWDNNQKSSQEFKLMFDIMHAFPEKNIVIQPESYMLYWQRECGSISSDKANNIVRFIELRMKMWQFIKTLNPQEVEESFFYNLIFQKIRILATYNAELAGTLFNQYIPTNFVPQRSLLTPYWYILLFRFLGFVRSEKTSLLLKKK